MSVDPVKTSEHGLVLVDNGAADGSGLDHGTNDAAKGLECNDRNIDLADDFERANHTTNRCSQQWYGAWCVVSVV